MGLVIEMTKKRHGPWAKEFLHPSKCEKIGRNGHKINPGASTFINLLSRIKDNRAIKLARSLRGVGDVFNPRWVPTTDCG